MASNFLPHGNGHTTDWSRCAPGPAPGPEVREMSNTTVRRSGKVGLILSLALVIGLFLGVMPAMASAVSTAFVNVHNVLAGQDGKIFTVRVNNTEPAGIGGLNAGKTINEVRIRPPVDLIDAVLPGSSGPGGFTDIRVVGDPPAEIRFRGGSLAPGSNGTFTIAADVRDTLTSDLGDSWRIRVSSDSGLNHQAATATGEGLVTTVRVLQVQSVTVLSPSGAVDDRDGDGLPEVSGTQSPICVRTRVFNAAATALNVTPSLSAGSFNVGPARPASNCASAPLTGGSASIPSRTAADFDFVLTADDVNGKTTSELVGSATAGSTTTPDTPDPDDDDFLAKRGIVIEPRSRFTYNSNTLAPRAVKPGSPSETFSLSFNKIPAGSAPLQTLGGRFESAFCNANLATPTNLGGGAVNNQAATFASCPIALLPDGRYQPTARLSYTDANGLVRPLEAIKTAAGGDLEKVRLDSLLPDVDIEINPPPVEVTAVPPVQPAITDGEAFTASGTATDTSPETGEETPCGPNPGGSTAPLPCTLESAFLLQYPSTAAQGGGTPFGTKIDVKNQCSLAASGNISCNITVPEGGFVTGTQSASLEVIVKDETGSLSDAASSRSPLIDVDIVDPLIQTATTARGGTITVGTQQVPGQRRTINVAFSEPVEDSNNPQDWLVQEGDSTVAVCNVNQSADKRTATLTTCQELPADAEGLIIYDPSLPTSNPYHDRVGQEIQDLPLEIDLTDGIAPLAPSFGSVNNRRVQDGSFFFNTSTASVRLIQETPASAEDPAIANGYTIELYKETNGIGGLQRGAGNGDAACGGDVAAGSTATVSCNFGTAQGSADVYALSIDTNSNVGAARVANFTLDTTRPTLASATVTGTQISLSFSEAVPSTRACVDPCGGANQDATANWSFEAFLPSGQRISPPIEDVSPGANNTQLLISFDSQEHDPATLDPERVRYIFDLASELERYEDRAGNQLLDTTLLI